MKKHVGYVLAMILLTAVAIVAAQTSTMSLRANNIGVSVTAEGVRTTSSSVKSTSINGVQETCINLRLGTTTAAFCEPADSGPVQYVCDVMASEDGIDGVCTCTGTCAGLPDLCSDLAGELSSDDEGGVCSF